MMQIYYGYVGKQPVAWEEDCAEKKKKELNKVNIVNAYRYITEVIIN